MARDIRPSPPTRISEADTALRAWHHRSWMSAVGPADRMSAPTYVNLAPLPPTGLGKPTLLIVLVVLLTGGARLSLNRSRAVAPASSPTPRVSLPIGTGRQPMTVAALGRTQRRPPKRWLVELVILVAMDVVYESLRNLVPHQRSRGVSLATSVDALERSLHWNFDRWLNHALAGSPQVAQLVEDYYSWLFLPVTIVVLVWVFLRHPGHYRHVRTALVVITLLALVCFYLYPMAPPRLLPGGGFIDTSRLYPTLGSWSTPTVADTSNQYAAMPSLHCAWALWNGLVVARLARRRWLRVLGMTYPVLTYLAVVATANHFTVDAVCGMATTVGVIMAITAPGHFSRRRTQLPT